MATLDKTLAVVSREKTGTTSAHAVRRAGHVPGIIFGHGSEPKAVALDAKAFDELIHLGGKNALLTVTIDGGGRDTALVREVQRDPITRRVLHVDLQRVRATEEISASLPVVTIGVADGVKNADGVLDLVLHTIDVKGPANALPEHIEVPVEHLGIHEKITAGDVKLPPRLTLDMDPATILISLEPSKVAEQAAEDEVTLAEQAAEAAAVAAAETPAEEETPAEGETADDDATEKG